MPVRATAAIRIISTTAGVVTFCVLRKMLSLPVSRVIHDDEDTRTVYINRGAPSQPHNLLGRFPVCGCFLVGTRARAAAILTFSALALDGWCNQMALYSARKTHTPFSHSGARAAPWAGD